VTREADVDALIKELEGALASVRRARRMAADLRRRDVGRPERQPETATVPVSRGLRHGGMTVAETAVALDMSEEYVRRLLRRGILVGTPYGGRIGWRLSREYVLRLQREASAAKEGQAAARRTITSRAKPAKQSSKPATGRSRKR